MGRAAPPPRPRLRLLPPSLGGPAAPAEAGRAVLLPSHHQADAARLPSGASPLRRLSRRLPGAHQPHPPKLGDHRAGGDHRALGRRRGAQRRGGRACVPRLRPRTRSRRRPLPQLPALGRGCERPPDPRGDRLLRGPLRGRGERAPDRDHPRPRRHRHPLHPLLPGGAGAGDRGALSGPRPARPRARARSPRRRGGAREPRVSRAGGGDLGLRGQERLRHVRGLEHDGRTVRAQRRHALRRLRPPPPRTGGPGDRGSPRLAGRRQR